VTDVNFMTSCYTFHQLLCFKENKRNKQIRPDCRNDQRKRESVHMILILFFAAMTNHDQTANQTK